MIFKNKKYAFSLTELLIVIVVLAVLFAALAPIITKRRTGANISNESVWNYVNDDEQQRDAYYDPNMTRWPSTAYIGLDANRVGNTSPVSKVVLKASKTLDYKNMPQRQIQFRFGSGNGVNAGSLFFDDRANLMISGNNDSFVKNAASSSYGNTIAGIGSFAHIGSGNYNTVYGANVLKGVSEGAGVGAGAIYTAVGQKILYNSPMYHRRKNIFIGSNSGQSETKGSISELSLNVAVGSNSMGSTDFYGARNVYLGYQVGNGAKSDRGTVNDNVIVGSQYYTSSSTGYYGAGKNVILGYDTFVGGPYNIQNLTVAGYAACNSFTSAARNGSRTCLGYASGGSKGIGGQETPGTFDTDSYDHVFLGGVPLPYRGGFNGRAVVEVHNQVASFLDSKVGDHNVKLKPKVSPTVVFNSNIVIRGNHYLPGDGGAFLSTSMAGLRAFKHDIITRDAAYVTSRRTGDRCRRRLWCCGNKAWFWNWGTETPADSFSAASLEYDTLCTNNLGSYNFNSACPQLQVSDIRLKDNIAENNSGLEAITSLLPYNYTFKSDNEKTPQSGVIAQDLQKVFKNSVYEGKDNYLRIRWDEMFYAAINAIKALDKKLEKIATDISGMEKDVNHIKSTHKQIQTRIVSLNNRAARLEKK